MKKTNRTYAGKPTKSKKQFRQIRNLFILTLILVALIGYYENSFEIEQAQAIQIQPAIQIYPEPETDLKKYVLTEVYKAGLNPDYVERLLHCESTWNNEAHTLEPNSTVSSGVWQINSVHKAKIVIKKKQAYLLLFSPNKKLKLPDNLHQSLTSKGKKWIELLKVNENLYYPVFIKEDSKGESNYLYDMEVLNWAVQDVEEDYKKYQDLGFWDKYGSIAIIGGTLGICFLLVIVTFKYSNGIIDKMAPLAQSFTEAAQALAKAQTTQVIGK